MTSNAEPKRGGVDDVGQVEKHHKPQHEYRHSNRSSIDDEYVQAWDEIWDREMARLRAKYSGSSNNNQLPSKPQSDGWQSDKSDSKALDSVGCRRNIMIPQQMLRLKVLERENASLKEENQHLTDQVCKLQHQLHERRRELNHMRRVLLEHRVHRKHMRIGS